MKKIIIAFVTMLMLAGGYEAKSQINTGVSFTTFYNELSPYGRIEGNLPIGHKDLIHHKMIGKKYWHQSQPGPTLYFFQHPKT